MRKKYYFIAFNFVLIFLFTFASANEPAITPGADRIDLYMPFIKDKRVGLVVNQTSIVGSEKTHLLDTLLALNIDIRRIFAPEHGFRGEAEAGETIQSNRDKKTGISIVSLFGKIKKPQPEHLSDVDVILFDIQDVGARFYTYISTLHYVMEACAENSKQLIVLDRPNPNDLVDGPILETTHKSFVGMHPIPVLHGLTMGELSIMINKEKWLTNGRNCKLTIIKIANWEHGQPYSLPVPPSPNLPNDQAIALYSSLCFFEATQISVGRGTPFPFQVVGYPNKKYGDFTFTPKSLPGFSKNPLQENKLCYGVDLRKVETQRGLTLKYVLDFYKKSNFQANFFSKPSFMDKLAGTPALRKDIIAGKTEDEIRSGWQDGLNKYKKMRKKYLLYQDNIN